MNRKHTKYQWTLWVLLAALGVFLPLPVAEGVSTPLDAHVEVFGPPVVSQINVLSFGAIDVHGFLGFPLSGGTVIIVPQHGSPTTGLCIPVGSFDSACQNFIQSAHNVVNGAPLAFYNITPPVSATAIGVFSGKSLAVSNFKTVPCFRSQQAGTTITSTVGQFNSGGTDCILGGATLTVPFGSTDDTYTVNYALTVDYP